ncbi:MAG: FxsA family protein, partial [Thermodesulfobacteriota bacterium]
MRLILIFIVVPLIEILLLIEIGSRIGALNTIFIIVLTGILGASMMRHQGFTIIRNIQRDLSQGRMPTGELINGALVLV